MEKPYKHVTKGRKDPSPPGLKWMEGLWWMPDLLCCYTFSSLPQEWKVRNSLDQRSKCILNTAVNKWFQRQSRATSPIHCGADTPLVYFQWPWKPYFWATEPKWHSLEYLELQRLQVKQRWGNASYPELPSPS